MIGNTGEARGGQEHDGGHDGGVLRHSGAPGGHRHDVTTPRPPRLRRHADLLPDIRQDR